MIVFRLAWKAIFVFVLFFLALVFLGFNLGRRGVFSSRPTASVTSTAIEEKLAPEKDGAATFRLARDTELSRQYERLRELVAAEQTTATVRQAAEEALWRLIRIEAAEHEAETALALQGWPGATVNIVGNEATVVIPTRSLGPAEAAQIGRLVATAAGIPETAVRILERP